MLYNWILLAEKSMPLYWLRLQRRKRENDMKEEEGMGEHWFKLLIFFDF